MKQLTVPTDVLGDIISYCDVSTILSVGLVNKQWKECTENDNIWSNLYKIKFSNAKEKITKSIVYSKKRKTEKPFPFPSLVECETLSSFKCNEKKKYALRNSISKFEVVSLSNIYPVLSKLFEEDEPYDLKDEDTDMTTDMHQLYQSHCNTFESFGEIVMSEAGDDERIIKMVIKHQLTNREYTVFYITAGNPFGSIHESDFIEPLAIVWDGSWELCTRGRDIPNEQEYWQLLVAIEKFFFDKAYKDHFPVV